MFSQASQLMKFERCLSIEEFAVEGKGDRNSPDPEKSLQLVENMQYLDSAAFISEVELIKEIVNHEKSWK